MIIEENQLHGLTKGKMVGGNSWSDYGYLGRPSSRWMSYARNHVTRPPHNDPSNWLMHETWTTDGSGWVSSGFADSVVPGGVVVSKDMAKDIFYNMPPYGHGPTLVHSLVGSTLKVLGGPGAGFSSVVTGWEAGTRTLTLETETDQWFRPGNCTLVQPVSSRARCCWHLGCILPRVSTRGQGGNILHDVNCSVLAVVASVGMKAVVGNRFEWTEVIQQFGNILGGVVADNSLTDVRAYHPV